MNKSNPTPATAKKHQVFVGAELQSESNKYEDLTPILEKLWNENTAEIKVVNHHYKKTVIYTKGRYDKNYRTTNGIYEEASCVKTDEAVK